MQETHLQKNNLFTATKQSSTKRTPTLNDLLDTNEQLKRWERSDLTPHVVKKHLSVIGYHVKSVSTLHTFFIALGCMKCSLHQVEEYLNKMSSGLQEQEKYKPGNKQTNIQTNNKQTRKQTRKQKRKQTYPFDFHCWYTCKYDKWSLSGT